MRTDDFDFLKREEARRKIHSVAARKNMCSSLVGRSDKVSLYAGNGHDRIVKFHGDVCAAVAWLEKLPDHDPSGAYRLLSIAADAAKMVRENRKDRP